MSGFIAIIVLLIVIFPLGIISGIVIGSIILRRFLR